MRMGSSIKACAPFIGACTTRPRWPRPKSNTKNHTSPTVWVKYALLDDPASVDPALAGKKVSTIIWTTTPWTLPASMAVAFHPDEKYVALESGGEVYIVASKLAQDAAAKCGLADPRELAHFPAANSSTSTFSIRFSTVKFSAYSLTTSPWTLEPASSTPLRRTARKIS